MFLINAIIGKSTNASCFHIHFFQKFSKTIWSNKKCKYLPTLKLNSIFPWGSLQDPSKYFSSGELEKLKS